MNAFAYTVIRSLLWSKWWKDLVWLGLLSFSRYAGLYFQTQLDFLRKVPAPNFFYLTHLSNTPLPTEHQTGLRQGANVLWGKQNGINTVFAFKETPSSSMRNGRYQGCVVQARRKRPHPLTPFLGATHQDCIWGSSPTCQDYSPDFSFSDAPCARLLEISSGKTLLKLENQNFGNLFQKHTRTWDFTNGILVSFP